MCIGYMRIEAVGPTGPAVFASAMRPAGVHRAGTNVHLAPNEATIEGNEYPSMMREKGVILDVQAMRFFLDFVLCFDTD